ncbi:MAG TPA: response regulator [Candidatus Solibacter sp.]
MAGEPILIVDDTPVNLKLTRILLVNEGYKVLTAASAEEALELLRDYQPRLILADIQLPGIDGLEMTRRIKQDERTRDTLVVALTAFAMKGDEERAIEAGCDGYMIKPIDTRSFGGRIRELLDRRAATQAAADVPGTERESVPMAEMQTLRRRFLVEGEDAARRLFLELDGPFHAADAARAVHQWIGTGGLLGFSVIARLAREVEKLLYERPVDTAQVRETLTNLILAFNSPHEARETPIPGSILETLSGKRIAVVGLPAHETQLLCVALEDAQAHVEFYELATAPDPAQLAACDLVVTYVHPQSAHSAWLDPLMAGGRPTLFVGGREDLLALDPAVQAMASEFLMEGWQPDEALVRLSLLLLTRKKAARAAVPPGGPTRVLVAAGDGALLALVRTALENAGMEVHHAGDGAAAMELAQSDGFQAAVLDTAWPGADVFQLLAGLHAGTLAMPIVLLTGRQREADIIRGFALGADDYVVKPFSPMELVVRLKRLIKN